MFSLHWRERDFVLQGNNTRAIIKCQSSTCPNLQLLLPPQATFATDAPEVDNDTEGDKEAGGDAAEPKIQLLSAKKLAKHLGQQQLLIAVIASPNDTPASNIAIEAALRADKNLSRFASLVLAAGMRQQA
jgi:hypothetical protein